MHKFINFIINIKKGYNYFYKKEYTANTSSGRIHTKHDCSKIVNAKTIRLSKSELEKYKIRNPYSVGCYYCNREMYKK
jgi:hypothetical protein